MENLNTQTQTENPQIAELEKQIENLREQLASADAAIIRKADEMDAILTPLFSALEPRIHALVESIVTDVASDAAREEIENFDISHFEYEIGEMIDDRLPERQDEDEQREAVESIVKEVLAGATITIETS